MPSPVARQAILLSGTAVKPVWQANFLTASSLPAGLTYTKSGSIPATLFDSTGKLTYQGNNLYINSGSATNTARTISTTAGINYYIWVQTSSGSATVVASGTNSTTFNGSAGGTFTAFTATTGTLTLTPTSNYANITQVVVAQITYESALRTADNVVTGASIYLAPRLDTNPSTLAPRGLLVEEARTNLIYQSNAIGTTPWNTAGSTVSGSAATSPDGTNDAFSINDGSATSSRHILYQVIQGGTTAATTYTYSGYFKAGSQPYFWVQFGSGSDTSYSAAQVFNMTGSGSLGETRLGGSGGTIVGTPSIMAVGNGWFRVSFSASIPTKTDGTLVFGPALAATGNNWNGTSNQIIYNGTSSITTYNAFNQFELGSFATSYIPTTSSTASRAADVITFSGVPLAALQGAQGTFLVQMSDPNEGFASGTGVLLGGNSKTWLNMTSSKASAFDSNIVTANTATAGQPVRVGISWLGASGSVSMNGGTVATGTNSGFTGQTSATLGSYFAYPQSGHYTSVALYNQRLPDAKLKSLSVVGAPY